MRKSSRASVWPWILRGLLSAGVLIACAPAIPPTPFRPPSPRPTLAAPTTATSTPPAVVQDQTATAVATPTIACFDNLTFVDDITFPDGTIVLPDSRIDKQWQVTNSGTCDWDERYHLRHIGGSLLGAQPEQALFPARAGTDSILSITFSVPAGAGTYQSQWQAFGPEGMPFGDYVYLEVITTE